MKNLSAQFDEMIIFGRVVFFDEIWEFLHKIKYFNILRKIFIIYCRHPFNHELSVFLCVIVMDKSMFCSLSWTFRSSFGLLLKLGVQKNRKLRTYCPVEIFTLLCTKNRFLAEIMELSIFLTHKVIPCTFPSLIKAVLGKQGMYLLLSIGIIRNLSQKTARFPYFLGLFSNFHQLTWIFCWKNLYFSESMTYVQQG